MKKIGILFGQEHSFPPAFVDRVNQKTGGKDIAAEFVKIDKVIQGEPCGYDVVIDRISQDVPFYRAWLKNAALTGTAVVATRFWLDDVTVGVIIAGAVPPVIEIGTVTAAVPLLTATTTTVPSVPL